jgi:hypothetical protein
VADRADGGAAARRRSLSVHRSSSVLDDRQGRRRRGARERQADAIVLPAHLADERNARRLDVECVAVGGARLWLQRACAARHARALRLPARNAAVDQPHAQLDPVLRTPHAVVASHRCTSPIIRLISVSFSSHFSLSIYLCDFVDRSVDHECMGFAVPVGDMARRDSLVELDLDLLR